ncbi:hypothetical protein PFISCL1PPCAC_3846, partial [Pristionchus fissidentatus]
ELLKRRCLVRDALRCKKMQCLNTGVRYTDATMKKAFKIDFYVMDGTPTVIVYQFDPTSYISTHEVFTTVGNILNVNILRNTICYEVHDEYWTLVGELPMPKRCRLNTVLNKKCLEVITTARCLCPEAQDRHNDRYRSVFYTERTKEEDKEGFVMFTQDRLHNLAYYGEGIYAHEYE